MNNVNEAQYKDIEQYMNNAIETLKNEESVNLLPNLFSLLKNNMFLVILLWLFGMILIGGVFVYSIVIARGFLLGYTISAFITVLGVGKGSLYVFSSLFLQNIIFIPCLFTIAVSSKTLYKSIMNNREKDTVKVQVIRHTLISIIMSIFIIASSFVEIYVSRQLLLLAINWI